MNKDLDHISSLNEILQAFEDAYALNLGEHRSVIGAPYVIKNTCGKDVVLVIEDDFDAKRCKADKENQIFIKQNDEAHLYDAKVEKVNGVVLR